MKNLKTITEKEILNAAWLYYLNLLQESEEDLRDSERIMGKKSFLYEERVNRYSAIEKELHELALKLEKNKWGDKNEKSLGL